MSEELKIMMVQAEVSWKNIPVNLKSYDKILASHPRCDLIVFPEMFSTGFIADPESVVSSQGEVLAWLQQKAKETQSSILCTHPVREVNTYFNRLLFVTPEGSMQQYDKRHLFTYGGEKENYSPGNQQLIIEVGAWKIKPLICYDLRFPVWSRNQENYDLLIYLANWPAARTTIWETLLKARAIENQCYALGVNRVGTDGNGVDHTGHSMITAPDGSAILSMGEREGVCLHSLKKENLHKFRMKFPFLEDRDGFEIVI